MTNVQIRLYAIVIRGPDQQSILGSIVVVYPGDKHSDCEPERHRHVGVFLHATDLCCRGGRLSNVRRQRL